MRLFVFEWIGWALIELGDILDSATFTPPLHGAGQAVYRFGGGGSDG